MQRSRGSERPGGHAGGTWSSPSTFAAVAVTLLVLLSLATAGGGPAELGEPRVPLPLSGSAGRLADLADVGERTEPQPEPVTDPGDTPWALIVVGVLATALAALAIRALRPARPGDRGGITDAPAAASDAAGAEQHQLVALRRAAATAHDELVQTPAGSARDAVVAAWLALERAAAAGGTSRSAAQTPTEFTAAVLARHGADETATTTLLRLYHQARFGSAPLPPEAPQRAAAALEAVTTALTAVRS